MNVFPGLKLGMFTLGLKSEMGNAKLEGEQEYYKSLNEKRSLQRDA